MYWWKIKTRVINPNRINVTKKCVAPKVHEEHATHLLLETRVRHELFHASIFLNFINMGRS
jgi:hypothetical protein